MIDISIRKVRMVWDTEPPEGEPCVKVYRKVKDYDNRYTSSWDIMTERTNRSDNPTSVQLLLERFVHMAVVEQIDALEIHSALMAVPEYRSALIEAGTVFPGSA
jgi:hypothetical protein